jgi:hypothetical protein
LARLLPFEQPLSVAREFENLDAFVRVGLLRRFVPVDLSLQALLLSPPLVSEPVEEVAYGRGFCWPGAETCLILDTPSERTEHRSEKGAMELGIAHRRRLGVLHQRLE